MFTGIIGTTGVLAAREQRGPGARLRIGGVSEWLGGPLAVGESIAVHGVCLTAETLAEDGFSCDMTAETLARTTLGSIPIGSRLHLERSLSVGDRLGGHIVSGHVDAKVRLRQRENLGEATKLVFEFPDRKLARFVAEKGSVAIDGVSLTVNGVSDAELEVVIIPHTLAVTTLGELAPGQEANLEVDLLARYVGRLLEPVGDERDGPKDAALLAKLKAAGFV